MTTIVLTALVTVVACVGGVLLARFLSAGARSRDSECATSPAAPQATGSTTEEPRQSAVRQAPEVISAKPVYHAVSIVPGTFDCAAVRDVVDQRFLSTEAPSLPLPDCDNDNCKCRFVQHEDRRSNEDRRDQFATFGGFNPYSADANNRRDKTDRRKS